jgi:hypothetical protein
VADRGSEQAGGHGRIRGRLRLAVCSLGVEETRTRAALYLKEHATALHVCDIYEQTLLQLDLALRARDRRRKKVLSELVDYYERKMLRSPRLRFHWRNGGSDMMEEPTVQRFIAQVENKHTDVDYADQYSPLDDEPRPAHLAPAAKAVTV